MTGPEAPALVAFEADPAALARVDDELRNRYGRDYHIVTAPLPTAGRVLDGLRGTGRRVIVVLAGAVDHRDALATLNASRAVFPAAKRCLLLTWGDRTAAEVILRGVTRGDLDYWLPRPLTAPDETFHQAIAEFLGDWSRRYRPSEALRVVGRGWDPPTSALRDMLTRNGIPFGFHEAGSAEADLVLAAAGTPAPARLPVLVLPDGSVQEQPSPTTLGQALGIATTAPAGVFDVAIVGAGPAGMAAAVYAASEGLTTAVVESTAIGGQAGTSSLIRNYLGFPRGINGADLAQRAYLQAWAFGARFVYGNPACGLEPDGDQRILTLSDGSQVRARAVVLAMGVTYRMLNIPDLERFHGAGVYYGAATAQAPLIVGQDVLVVGGGNSAGQAATYLAAHARRVTVLVRGNSLAQSMSDYLIRAMTHTPNITICYHSEITGGAGTDRLRQVTVRDHATGHTRTQPAVAAFIMIGASPGTTWLPDTVHRDPWGYLRTAHHPDAEHDRYHTALPGVFAVGDVRAGSVKRVASAVGEGSVVIGSVHDYLTTRPPPPPYITGVQPRA